MTLALDGSNTSSAAAVALTTTNATDVVILVISYSSSASVTGVTDTSGVSAAWQRRSRVTNSGQGYTTDVWYTTATGIFSGATISATFSGSPSLISACAFGVSGANLSEPWDANGSLPSTDGTGATSVNYSTTANDTFAIGVTFAGSGTTSMPDWLSIGQNNFQGVWYFIYSSAQSVDTYTPAVGSQINMIVDAIEKAGEGGGGSAAPNLRSLMGVGT